MTRKGYFVADFGVTHKISRATEMGWPFIDRAYFSAYIDGMNITTRLFTYFRGLPVGVDASGNRYYEEKLARPGHRRRRWVGYAPGLDSSSVPPEWHPWLHYTVDAPLADTGRKPWQKPHQPNLTGTPAGYRPPGHDYEGGRRAVATGDYEAWTPGS